jgi:hypothetical protein
MELEIHIPISLDDGFLNRLRYLVKSWELLGDPGLAYRFIITIGGTAEPIDLSVRAPWIRHYPISCRWFNDSYFRRHSWWGTINDRFRANIASDYALFLDADMLFIDSISESLSWISAGCEIAGVTGYGSPFRDLHGGETSQERWRNLFATLALPPPTFNCAHSATGEPCPPYFNNAFLLVNRDVARALAPVIFHEMENVDAATGHNHFRDQIALTIALCRLGIRPMTLPVRFNHYLWESNAPTNLQEWKQACVLHYTDNDIFSSEEDCRSTGTVEAWLERTPPSNLVGIRRRFRDALDTVHTKLLPSS